MTERQQLFPPLDKDVPDDISATSEVIQNSVLSHEIRWIGSGYDNKERRELIEKVLKEMLTRMFYEGYLLRPEDQGLQRTEDDDKGEIDE